MKSIFLIFVSFILSTLTFAQKAEPRKEIREGNKAYQDKKFDDAQKKYEQAIQKDAASFKGNFNLGDALYQKQDYEKARQAFHTSSQLTNDKKEKAQAMHNIGNTFL